VTPFLTVWVIYKSPRDYPGKFVVRAQDVFRDNPEPVSRPECAVCNSLEAARAALPRYQTHEREGRTYGFEFVRMERHPDDVPEIVETWI
jgi:hypothetical protein